MENLIREATEDTPDIVFDCQQNVLEIRGVSYPEDTSEFYASVFAWLEEYFIQLSHAAVTVKIEIVYFHSGSTKVLLYFFDKLVEEAKTGTPITVQWIYQKDETDMRDYGEEFQRNFKALTFHFVEKNG